MGCLPGYSRKARNKRKVCLGSRPTKEKEVQREGGAKRRRCEEKEVRAPDTRTTTIKSNY